MRASANVCSKGEGFNVTDAGLMGSRSTGVTCYWTCTDLVNGSKCSCTSGRCNGSFARCGFARLHLSSTTRGTNYSSLNWGVGSSPLRLIRGDLVDLHALDCLCYASCGSKSGSSFLHASERGFS